VARCRAAGAAWARSYHAAFGFRVNSGVREFVTRHACKPSDSLVEAPAAAQAGLLARARALRRRTVSVCTNPANTRSASVVMRVSGARERRRRGAAAGVRGAAAVLALVSAWGRHVMRA